MKKRIVTLFVFLLIACLMTTSCSFGDGIESNEEPIEEVDVDPDFVEVNCYDVGGVTFRLDTRIEDYITDKNVFRFNDLAADLGWYTRPVNGNPDPAVVSKILDIGGDEFPFIKFESFSYHFVDYVCFGTVPRDKIENGSLEAYRYCVFELEKTGDDAPSNENRHDPKPGTYYMYLHEDDLGDELLIYFSQIVITVYIMENYQYDLSDCFFDEQFGETGWPGWTIYE